MSASVERVSYSVEEDQKSDYTRPETLVYISDDFHGHPVLLMALILKK